MQTTDRDRLIGLLKNCEHILYLDSELDLPNVYDLVADHLLANGVTVQEVDGCETVKAMECLIGGLVLCKNCAYNHCNLPQCKKDVARDALDLINRKEEMIEALIAGQKTLQKSLAEKNAEIENITEKFNCQQTVYADLSKIIKDKNAEIERLKNNPTLPKSGFINLLCEAFIYTETLEQYNKFRRTFKAEAVKEFAERLKEKVESYDVYDGYKITIRFAVEEDTINNLVKEMVGEG